jgi:hypothetical protein
MKIPSLRACLLACVARFNPDAKQPDRFNNQPGGSPKNPPIKPTPTFFIKAKKQAAESMPRIAARPYLNQRQRRKDARRRHASGYCNAFAR